MKTRNRTHIKHKTSKKSQKYIDFNKIFRRKIKKQAIIDFTQELKIMLESGIDMLNTMELIADQCKDKHFQSILMDIKDHIAAGELIATAFMRHKDIFGESYINFLRIGETSGTLVDSINRLISSMESSQTIAHKVREAMFYPSIIIAFATLVVLFLTIYVVPSFADMFADSNVELPTITKMLLFVSNNIIRIVGVAIITIAGIYWLTKFLVSRKNNRLVLHKNLLKAPIFGKIYSLSAVAFLSQNLSLMLSAGMGIIDALDTLVTSTKNVHVSSCLATTRTKIMQGGEVSTCMALTGIYADSYVRMIKIGEESGNLPKMLERVANLAFTAMEKRIKTLLLLMEPALIITLGIIIGFIVTAIYLPIFSMSDTVR